MIPKFIIGDSQVHYYSALVDTDESTRGAGMVKSFRIFWQWGATAKTLTLDYLHYVCQTLGVNLAAPAIVFVNLGNIDIKYFGHKYGNIEESADNYMDVLHAYFKNTPIKVCVIEPVPSPEIDFNWKFAPDEYKEDISGSREEREVIHSIFMEIVERKSKEYGFLPPIKLVENVFGGFDLTKATSLDAIHPNRKTSRKIMRKIRGTK